ncbi:MAG TPA: DUF4126 family protein [Candidatus Angelobacter sp.]|jgi:uncharacterized membrane protein|nr:DUF4126 family protein [Candidatus Angelobacter sp.]
MSEYILALGIGFVAGLRTFTAPAAVSWGARLGTLTLNGSPFSFMASKAAVVIFSLLALGEYVGDLLPKTPKRTAPGPLIARIISGGLCGACMSVSAGHAWVSGALFGGIAGLIGAFAGYHARKELVEKLKTKDAMIAILEDLIAIGLGYLLAIS